MLTSEALADNTLLTLKLNCCNVAEKAPVLRSKTALIAGVPGVLDVTIPLKTLLPGKRVMLSAVMVSVDPDWAVKEPVTLSMARLVMVTVGFFTSNTLAILISGTVRLALVISVVPCVLPTVGVITMSKLPEAVNSVLPPAVMVRDKSGAPVKAL